MGKRTDAEVWADTIADVSEAPGRAFDTRRTRQDRIAILRRRRLAQEDRQGEARRLDVAVASVRWLPTDVPAPTHPPRVAPGTVAQEHADVARAVRGGRTVLGYHGWTVTAYPATGDRRPGGAALVEAAPIDPALIPDPYTPADRLVAWRVDLTRAIDLQVTEAVVAVLQAIDAVNGGGGHP